MAPGHPARPRVGRGRVAQHRLTCDQRRPEKGVQVAKSHARAVDIGIRDPRVLVPCQIGDGMHLQPGRIGRVVEHLAHKAKRTVGQRQQVSQQKVERRPVVSRLDEAGLRPADSTQDPVLAVQGACGLAHTDDAAKLGDHDCTKTFVRGFHHIVGKPHVQCLRSHSLATRVDAHNPQGVTEGQFSRQRIAIGQLMVQQHHIHPLARQRQPRLVERADVHQFPRLAVACNGCADAVCRRSQPTDLENDNHLASP